ncbi:Centractin [Rhizina undulata]
MGHPVLLTEASSNPRTNRDIAAQIFFETFNVPALFTSIQAVLSLFVPRIPLRPYAPGRTTRIVFDSGDGVSHTVPVYEGFAMPSAIRRIDAAGRDVTKTCNCFYGKLARFSTLRQRRNLCARSRKTCYIALDPKKEEKQWAGGVAGKVEEYRFPDGHVLKVCSERFRAPEILFNLEIIGLEYPGIHQVVVDAVN